MRIAVLISGEPRGLVFKEQIQFFTSLYNSLVKDGHVLHTYCMFKLNPKSDYIQSEEGLQNFNIILELFKPRYLEFFYEFKEDAGFRRKFKEIYPPMFFSQIKMIDHLITQANKSDYDLFLRIRPDCVLNQTLNLNSIDLETVYTSIKCDAPGNDQFFYFSREMLNKWWIPIIRPSLNYIYEMKSSSNLSPEYFIFNHCKKKQIIGSGLIRDYNHIISWIHYPSKPMVIENFWSYETSYSKLKIRIDKDLFLTKLKHITSEYNPIMNTDIPV
jgi:hypothetical protein